jgi:hypothetical protein
VDAAALAISAVAATPTVASIYFARDPAVAAKECTPTSACGRRVRCSMILAAEANLVVRGDLASGEPLRAVDRAVDERVDDRRESARRSRAASPAI